MEKEDFYIVGVGGSAGALTAFKELLRNVPDDARAAYVVIQHLLPNTESSLREILSGATRLPVATVKDGVRIKSGHVYIIPPDTDMVLKDATLKLSPRKGAGLNVAIDMFFNSLARYKKQNAIGVILSGTGSDGTLGLKAIKEAGGITFIQDKTAQFGNMPESAAAAHAANYILPPAQIAKRITQITLGAFKRNSEQDRKQRDLPRSDGNGLDSILSIVRRSSDVDFTYYKQGTIKRRIMRRMLLNNIEDYHHYADYLQKHPEEATSLYQDLLISVTDFFRDPEVFDFLQHAIFPELIKRNTSIRIWVPGCSTGEEVYSLAISLAELLEKSGESVPVHIFGTDLSEASLQIARHGLYPKTIRAMMTPEYLRKFFTEHGGQYQVNKNIRTMCVFAKHNMIADTPFSRMDIVSCRNVLIYLDSFLQKKVFPIFHYALNPDGLLILGTAETVGSFHDLFEQIDRKHKIYAKKSSSYRASLEFPQLRKDGKLPTMPSPVPPREKPEINIEKEATILMLKKRAAGGVVVNDDLTIVQFYGEVSPYLGPAQGRASLDLVKMAHKSFLPKILEMFGKVRKNNASLKHIYRSAATEIEIVPLGDQPIQGKYFLILFRSLGGKKSVATNQKKQQGGLPTRAEMAEALGLQKELSSTVEQLQAVIEARDASDEELKAAHEEVMSANEELQSTNEELETTKEELQSTNEELMTLNAELENRNADLERSAKEIYRKDEFLSYLGHELRNPLSPIMHSLELAKLRGIPDEELQQSFEVIDRQTRLLIGIVNNLLDAARAIGGKIEVNMESVDFDGVVGHAVETVRPLITAAGHTLELHPLHHPVSMLMDPGRVEQIIVNLLNNAAKYTKPGGRITLTVIQEGGRIMLSVRDNGIGIAPDALPHIFSLFFQGGQSLNNFKGGLGVGLMLAKVLAELHGGNLIARSGGIGKGSEFILSLPIRRSTMGNGVTKEVDVKDLKLKTRRILVVDDDVELADVFAKLLRELHQDVAVAYASSAALEAARTNRPDIIFIDVAMPQVSGYELVETLRKERGLKRTKFIALSGFGKEYSERSMEAGFDEHLIKPVSIAELQRVLS